MQPSECPIHSCIGPNLCARPLRASGRSLGRRRAANHPAHQRAVSGPGTILRFRPIAVMFGGLEHRGCAARRAYHIRCGCLVRNRWRARSPPVPNSSPPLALRTFECPKNGAGRARFDPGQHHASLAPAAAWSLDWDKRWLDGTKQGDPPGPGGDDPSLFQEATSLRSLV